MKSNFNKTFAGAFFLLALTSTSRSLSVDNNWNVTVNEAKEVIEQNVEAVQQNNNYRIMENAKNTISNMLKDKMRIVKGEVAEINGNILTVVEGDKTYKVAVTSTTFFLRRFWGNSTLAEVKVGDTLNITGRWTSEENYELNALLIRNLSNQKRYGVIFGEVVNVGTVSIEIRTVRRGNVVVNVSNTSKLVNREMKTIVLSDIKVGDRVRVKGLLNENNTITDVVQIKDFSQPALALPSPL